MNFSLPTKAQWRSVIVNTLLTFVSVFATALATSDLNKAAVYSAAASAVMAALKVVQKLVTEPRVS